MLNDPKVGYHWVWIVPLFWAFELKDFIVARMSKKNKKHTPELDRLRKLSGIDHE